MGTSISSSALPEPNAVLPTTLTRGLDRFSQILLLCGVAGIMAIVGVMTYEMVSRNVFDAPTAWNVEIVTYLVVATAFLPLAAVQRDGAHIRVELLDELVPDSVRSGLRTFGLWTSLMVASMMTWQFAILLIGDYQASMRDWGMLRVPLWMPEMPVLLGLAALAGAIFADLVRGSAGERGQRVLIAVGVIIATGLLLWWLGRKPNLILGREVDVGTLLIVGTTAICAGLVSGWRVAAIWTLSIATIALLTFLLADVGYVTTTGIFIALAILVFLVTGMPVSFAIGFVALFGLYFLLPVPQLTLLAERPWRSLNSYTYSAVPMFVLMGSVLIRSGITASFFAGVSASVGRAPGGLALASLGSSGLFAAVSGSSIATAATIGQVAGPEMLKRGYSSRLAMGSLAGGGTLGILIPPSVPMIVYGGTVGTSISALFLAGIVPGLIVLGSMMALVMVWSIMVPTAAPRGAKVPFREAVWALRHIVPLLVLILAVLGSIYSGAVTPTEAGAFGVVASILLSAFNRRLSVDMVVEATAEATKLSAGILFIVVATSILTWVLDYAHIPQAIVSAVESLGLSTFWLLALIAIFYIVLGMFIDPISMMLMTVSITLPLVLLAGYDAVWFGVTLMLMIEIGLITPPVGMILFVLRGLFPALPLREMVLGALPFVIVLLLNVALFAVFPEIVTFLPDMMKK